MGLQDPEDGSNQVIIYQRVLLLGHQFLKIWITLPSYLRDFLQNCAFFPHLDQSEVLITPGDGASLMLRLPARASFFSPSVLELVIKLQGFGSARLGAICVPNPAECIFYHRFVTVAVGGELHGRSAFRRMLL